MSPAPQPGPSAGNKRWWIWLPLLGVGGWLAFFADKTPSSGDDVAVPVRPAPAPRPNGAAVQQPAPAPRPTTVAGGPLRAASAPLVLLPREALVRSAPAAGAAGARSAAGKDLFGTRSWNPPPPPPPPPAPPAPPPPPVAPPLPFTFLGKKLEGDTWEVYLGRGDQTFVAHQGTVLEGAWRVDRIEPPMLSLTYLPLGQVQTLPIGETR
jgi:hypothetical protein